MATPKILHLTLMKKGFDLIKSGEKKVEYREIKPYWIMSFSCFTRWICHRWWQTVELFHKVHWAVIFMMPIVCTHHIISRRSWKRQPHSFIQFSCVQRLWSSWEHWIWTQIFAGCAGFMYFWWYHWCRCKIFTGYEEACHPWTWEDLPVSDICFILLALREDISDEIISRTKTWHSTDNDRNGKPHHGGGTPRRSIDGHGPTDLLIRCPSFLPMLCC